MEYPESNASEDTEVYIGSFAANTPKQNTNNSWLFGTVLFVIFALFILFLISGIVAVPILHREKYTITRQNWLTIHQECQCKYANITPLIVTTVVKCIDKPEESVTFVNINTTGIIGVTRTCYIEHPIQTMNAIRYDNPYETYYFLSTPVDGALNVWFIFGCIALLCFCVYSGSFLD